MSRLEMESPGKADIVLDGLYKDLTRRVYASPTKVVSDRDVTSIS